MDRIVVRALALLVLAAFAAGAQAQSGNDSPGAGTSPPAALVPLAGNYGYEKYIPPSAGAPTLHAVGYPSSGTGPAISGARAVSDAQDSPGPDVWADPACAEQGGFYTGGGVYFVKPYFNHNPAFTVTHALGSSGLMNPMAANTSSQTSEFDFDPSFSPRVWLGYSGENGLGIRGRWWRFDQGSNVQDFLNADTTGNTVLTSASPLGIHTSTPTTSVLLNPPTSTGADSYRFASSLKLDVYDLEGTQNLAAGSWSLLLSGGLRYAHIAQAYQVDRVNSGTVTTGTTVQNVTADTDALRAAHNFDGLGPVAALEAQHALGGTGFSLFANARGAVLVGRGRQDAFLRTGLSGTTNFLTGVTGGLGDPRLQSALDNSDGTLPVAEFEIGASWSKPLGHSTFFTQTSVIGQTWFGAGNATSTDGNMSFFGLSLMAGFHY